ncbi:MAG: hypothetical protein WBF35_12580, partial [Candidatus Acidiferrales bacterium]
MNRQRTVQRAAIAGAALSLAGVLLAQAPAPAPAPKQLVVNGRVTNAAIVQVGGRSYVDIDTLAQLTNGSVSISPTQIVLTIPNANGTAPSTS